MSSATPDGITTRGASETTGLSRPTTHRLLSSLAADGFLERDDPAGRWHLGPEMYFMGGLAAERHDISDVARESVRALAAATGESAFLSVRRGLETVCVLREEGAFPIRSFVLREGVRFPLGVASAGLAILSFLPDATADRYLRDEEESLHERFGPEHSADRIRARIRITRTDGFATNPALILEGSWGMGAAVFDAAGQPSAALSLTGIESRFSTERRPTLGRLLLEHAHVISRRLAKRLT